MSKKKWKFIHIRIKTFHLRLKTVQSRKFTFLLPYGIVIATAEKGGYRYARDQDRRK